MSLHDRILELRKNDSGRGHNGILLAFSLDMCKQIDKAKASGNDYYSKKIKDILKLLENCQAGYSVQLQDAFQKYSECAMHREIRSKGIVIKEEPNQEDLETPDFNVEIDGKNYS